jgi:hypothetical protein
VSEIGLECLGGVLGSDLARFVISMHESGNLVDDLELVVLLYIVRSILGTWLLDVSKLCVIDDSDNLRLDALGAVFPDLQTKLFVSGELAITSSRRGLELLPPRYISR